GLPGDPGQEPRLSALRGPGPATRPSRAGDGGRGRPGRPAPEVCPDARSGLPDRGRRPGETVEDRPARGRGRRGLGPPLRARAARGAVNAAAAATVGWDLGSGRASAGPPGPRAVLSGGDPEYPASRATGADEPLGRMADPGRYRSCGGRLERLAFSGIESD